MNSKLMTFTLLGIFLVSLVAAVTFSASVPSSIDLSTSELSNVFTITSTEDGTTGADLDVVLINSDDSAIVSGPLIISDGFGNEVKISFTDTTVTPASVIPTLVSSLDKGGSTFDVNASVTSVDAGFALGTFSESFKFNISDSSTPADSELRDVTINFKNTFCEAGEAGVDLEIDVDFEVTGYSPDDDEWYMLDEVEVTVNVENKNNDDDIDDITIEWGLYNTRTGEFIIDDEENDFNLDDDEDKDTVFTFTVDPSEFDDDDSDGDFVFYVKAYSDDLGEENECVEEVTDITIVIDDNFVVMENLDVQESVQCDATVEGSVKLWNIGDEDEEEEVKLLISNSELNIAEEIEVGDIDKFDDKRVSFSFNIPANTEEGSYLIRFSVEDEDGDIFENDEDDESRKSIALKVLCDGFVSGEAEVAIGASLDSEAVAGEEVTVKATVSNTGNSEITYVLIAGGLDNWASNIEITPSSLTLSQGETRDVLIKFTPNDDVSGTNDFLLQAVYNGKVTEKTVTVPVQESQGFSFLTGNTIGSSLGGSWFIWLIVLLNIVLVVLIVVVASRMLRK